MRRTRTQPTSTLRTTEGRANRTRRPLTMAALGLTVGLAALSATACMEEEGSGDPSTVVFEDFDDPRITGISVQDDFDVRVVVDPSQPQSGSITIDDNLLDRGYAFVDDGVLTIDFDGWGDVDPSRMPLVTLSVQSLDTVENHGKGHVVVSGVDADDIEIVNTDEGEVAVAGRAQSVELSASSDGAVDLATLVAADVELADTDDGPISVHATESVTGEISGDADVVLFGNPSVTDVTVAGDGVLVPAL
jgi:hypothetical protein